MLQKVSTLNVVNVNTQIILTRCQIFHLNCIKFNVGWGSVPDPAGGAYSAPSDPLDGFGEGKGKGRTKGMVARRKKRGRGSGGKGGRMMNDPHPPCQNPRSATGDN